MYSTPLGYFITFHTYATWLHGDVRGSVDPKHNAYGAPRVTPDPELLRRDASKVVHEPVTLDPDRRDVVERTIREVCEHRGWSIHALHVRTNHVHLVVSADVPPERVMNAIKSWSTRRMVEAGLLTRGARGWTRHGSTRYLWKPEHVAAAIDYVVNGQGPDLPGSTRR